MCVGNSHAQSALGCRGKSIPGLWGQTELTASAALAFPSSVALGKSRPLSLCKMRIKEPLLIGLLCRSMPQPQLACVCCARSVAEGTFGAFFFGAEDWSVLSPSRGQALI